MKTFKEPESYNFEREFCLSVKPRKKRYKKFTDEQRKDIIKDNLARQKSRGMEAIKERLKNITCNSK